MFEIVCELCVFCEWHILQSPPNVSLAPAPELVYSFEMHFAFTSFRSDVSKLKFEGKTFYVIGIQKEVSAAIFKKKKPLKG